MSQTSRMRYPSKPMRFFTWEKWASQRALSRYPQTSSKIGVSSEAFDEVLDVWVLLHLAAEEGSEVLLGLVFYWSSGPSVWRSIQRVRWIGVKSRFSNNILGEPPSFTFPSHPLSYP